MQCRHMENGTVLRKPCQGLASAQNGCRLAVGSKFQPSSFEIKYQTKTNAFNLELRALKLIFLATPPYWFLPDNGAQVSV